MKIRIKAKNDFYKVNEGTFFEHNIKKYIK